MALAETGRPADALAALDAVPEDRRPDYQPWWAATGHVAALAGDAPRAAAALDRAAALAPDPAVRDWLRRRESSIRPK